MITDNELIGFIKDYTKEILEFEKTLRHLYKIESLVYNNQNEFPRTGKISVAEQIVEYRFHGMGCSFTRNGTEVNYDVYATEKNYISTSPYFFSIFITTSKNISNIPKQDIIKYLSLLAQENYLIKVYENYHVYLINLEKATSTNI